MPDARDLDPRRHEDQGTDAKEFDTQPVLVDEREDYPNLAEDEDLVEEFVKEVLPITEQARIDRWEVESSWTRWLNLLLLKDDDPAYRGLVQMYLAMARQIMDGVTTILRQGLFPTDDPFEVEASEEFEDQIESVRTIIDHDLREMMQIKRRIKPGYRNMLAVGFGCGELGWRERGEFRRVPRLYAGSDSLTGGKTTRLGFEDLYVYDYRGPAFTVLNPFAVYFWPGTAETPDDCLVAFKDMILRREDIEQGAKEGAYLHVDEIDKLGVAVSDVSYAQHLKDRASEVGHQVEATQGRKDPYFWATDTECRLKVRVEGGGREERKCWVLHSGKCVFSITENPTWHKQSKFLLFHWAEMTDNIYGYGMASALDDIQRYVNAMMSLGMFNAIMSESPIVAIDPDAEFKADSIRVKPLAKWIVKPGMVEIKRLQSDNGLGMQTVQFLMNMAHSIAGTPPVLFGQLKGDRGEQTGMVQKLMAQNAQLPLQDTAQDNEDELLNPLMRRAFILRQQHTTEGPYLALTGRPKARIPLKALVGRYGMRWMGYSQSQDQLRQMQGLPAFMKAMERQGTKPIDVIEKGQKRYYQINTPKLTRNLYALMTRARDAKEVVADITDEVNAQMAKDKGAPGGGPPTPGAPIQPGAGGPAAPQTLSPQDILAQISRAGG